MSNKQLALEAVQSMPEEATWDEILEQLAQFRQERVEALKALLHKGLEGEAEELTEADWDAMRDRYDTVADHQTQG